MTCVLFKDTEKECGLCLPLHKRVYSASFPCLLRARKAGGVRVPAPGGREEGAASPGAVNPCGCGSARAGNGGIALIYCARGITPTFFAQLEEQPVK